MQHLLRRIIAVTILASSAARGAEPDWSATATLPPEGHRANIYELPEGEWREAVRRGVEHALSYPVTVTGTLPPYEPTRAMFDGDRGLGSRIVAPVVRRASGFDSFDDMMDWLGVRPYPRVDGTGGILFPGGIRPETPMGLTLIARRGAVGMTFSCALCHVGHVFGRPVFGLTNRFPHANEFYVKATAAQQRVDAAWAMRMVGATSAEIALQNDVSHRMRWMGARSPVALGLDTSLAQVALSLARRGTDPYASLDEASAASPRPSRLDTLPGDSKPSVWWTMKYKTRWLSDASIRSGNPMHTNLLWNELGRAVDLHDLEGWLADNESIVEDLTAAVFATEPPQYTDFFPAESVDLASARRGQGLFAAHCARCHGTYEKAWDEPGGDVLPPAERLATTRVRYHSQTFPVDVGTDPYRWQAMPALAPGLNGLALSQAAGIVVEPQQGYVPPPLVGIWARWPYFHNNSVPSLCAVLTRAADRPVTYVSGEPVDPRTDFDRRCNGYPVGDAVPASWRERPEHVYDTRRAGMANTGHDEGIFLENGRELLTPDAKLDLVEFLKTL